MFIRWTFRNTWAVAVSLLILAAACENKVRIRAQEDKLAYSIGYSMGKNIEATLSERGDDPSDDHLVAGIRAALAGSSDVLTEEEMLGILTEHQQVAEEKARERAIAENEENLKAGEAYLQGNKDRSGVNTLPSGIQYKVLEDGDGIRPTMDDTVLAYYVGRFTDGEKFEGTEANEPIYFPLKRVIAGWQEILQLMPVGSKWEVSVPAELGYGERGRPDIPPNSVLIFEVELLGIKGKTVDVEN
jgi:FKBP-type peptidyl-prolyl cis-trans isomerase